MFFQNVFDSEFVGSMIYADRQYNITFKCPANKNRSDLMICWNEGPFNLVGNTTFTINFSLDNVYYSPIAVTLPSSSTATAQTIVDTLNADVNFSAWYVAMTYNDFKQVAIKTNKTRLQMRTYISNSSAETILGFNARAGVSELPTYYERHTIENAPIFPDSVGMLIALDVSDSVDQAIITAAGFDYSDELEDWQLLRGRAESFRFTLNSYDGTNRLEESIEMQAGSLEGDLAKKTLYEYDGVSTRVAKVFQIPYVLDAADITNATPA